MIHFHFCHYYIFPLLATSSFISLNTAECQLLNKKRDENTKES